MPPGAPTAQHQEQVQRQMRAAAEAATSPEALAAANHVHGVLQQLGAQIQQYDAEEVASGQPLSVTSPERAGHREQLRAQVVRPRFASLCRQSAPARLRSLLFRSHLPTAARCCSALLRPTTRQAELTAQLRAVHPILFERLQGQALAHQVRDATSARAALPLCLHVLRTLLLALSDPCLLYTSDAADE